MRPMALPEEAGVLQSLWHAYVIIFGTVANQWLLPCFLATEAREVVAPAPTTPRSQGQRLLPCSPVTITRETAAPATAASPRSSGVNHVPATSRLSPTPSTSWSTLGPHCSLVTEAVGTGRVHAHKNVRLIDHEGAPLNYKFPFQPHVHDLATIRLPPLDAAVKTYGLYKYLRPLFSSKFSVEAEDWPRRWRQKVGRSCAGTS